MPRDLLASQLRKFTFNELKAATRNFRPESILGEGGFGCVFKGWIEENGTAAVKPGTRLTVDVKTLNHDGLQGHKECLASVKDLVVIKHTKLAGLGVLIHSSFTTMFSSQKRTSEVNKGEIYETRERP
ncbi:hypothetical protein Syun_004045 [Stephania yunnanensis]|uniref:Interleukin-1 receptor-associated kinase 4 n=1 Tax=Stephania yunnanensis TaxID=152371 RepID=A0AAP0L3N9_9MAGN